MKHEWRTHSSTWDWKSRLERLLPYTALAALSLLVVPSLLVPGQMLCSAVDGRNFYVRLHEFSWLADQGVLWPRWAPNWSYGYGYPIFHYYGSLALYPSLILHQLGLSLVSALQVGFWLSFVVSGWAAYAWLQQVTGDDRAALIGALAYLYVPYHLNTALYRVNLSESWALVFPPLALYGLHRLARRLDWGSTALTALSLAALPLTSNPATLVFIPLLITYTLLLLWTSRERRRLLVRQLASGALALGMAAFFLVPALIDRQAVQIEQGYTPGGLNVFHNFIPLVRTFWQPFIADVSRANPLYDPLSLGWVVPGISLLLLAILWKRLPRTMQQHVIWALPLGAFGVFMATRAAAPVYRFFSWLQVLQFPWRFLAPAVPLVGLLASLAARAVLGIGQERWSRLAVMVAAALLVVVGWPLVYPGLFCDQTPTPTLAQAVAKQIGMVGSLSTTAEYLPATVREIPTQFPMLDDYTNERPVIRWDQTGLPEGAQTLHIDDQGLRGTWEVDTPVAFAATYRAFMFPGWQAAIDGKRVAIDILPPHGLIQIPVPAGHHVVTVRFGSTPDRVLTAGLSLGALSLTLWLLLRRVRTPVATLHHFMTPTDWLIAAGVGIMILLLRVGPVDHWNWLPRIKRFDGQTVQGLEAASIHYSAGERLLGYELLTSSVAGGQPLQIDLYWATDTGHDFRALVRLTDTQGLAWSEWDTVVDWAGLIGPPAPWRWGPDHYTSMRYQIDVPLGTPPGAYQITVATIDPQTKTPHFVTQGTAQNAERTAAIVGQVWVQRQQAEQIQATSLAQPAESKPTVSVRPTALPRVAAFSSSELTLVECQVSQRHAYVGETVTLWPLWYAASSPKTETLTLELRDPKGQTALVANRPFSARYRPAQWQPGELVRDQLQVLVPAHLPPGSYLWSITVQGMRYDVGELTVSVPERQYDLPEQTMRVDQPMGEFAELSACQISSLVPGQPLQVTLYWRARQETETGYKTFVHLIDSQARVVAQSDMIPASWTRLTTSWLPPEVIQDAHVLYPSANLAPGVYRILAGLYEPISGQRVLTAQGENAVTVAERSVSAP